MRSNSDLAFTVGGSHQPRVVIIVGRGKQPAVPVTVEILKVPKELI
jgi:hypothetical protein